MLLAELWHKPYARFAGQPFGLSSVAVQHLQIAGFAAAPWLRLTVCLRRRVCCRW